MEAKIQPSNFENDVKSKAEVAQQPALNDNEID